MRGRGTNSPPFVRFVGARQGEPVSDSVSQDDSAPVDETRRPARVRDHLANERTYLAWMRTSIALMGFGVVIVRLRHLSPQQSGQGNGWLLGFVFALVGLLTVALSTCHYFEVRRSIDLDTYSPSGRWVVLFSMAVALLGAGVLYFLFSSPTVTPAALP